LFFGEDEGHGERFRNACVDELIQVFVMLGLVPGIHVFSSHSKKDVDGRDKPGHDGVGG
jgi:hypothetical protein